MHTHPFNVPLSMTAWVRRYQKKHLPTHTHPDTSFINFLYLLRSIACSLFNFLAWQSFSTTPVQVLFGLSLGLGLSASYYFFTLFATCPYHRSLFCCCTNAMSSLSNLSLSSLFGNLSFTCHISIWPFSSLLTEVRPNFLSLQARSHFHAAYWLTDITAVPTMLAAMAGGVMCIPSAKTWFWSCGGCEDATCLIWFRSAVNSCQNRETDTFTFICKIYPVEFFM